MIELTQSLIKELMTYDPVTGICVWKSRTPEHQPDLRLRNGWNTYYAGKEVGSVSKVSGYLQTSIFCKLYQLHRLIWFYVHGVMPENIDHINSIRTDNRLSNLRSVSQHVNNKNAKRRKDNTTGVTGVDLTKSGKWLVRIRVNKELIRGGLFEDFSEAVKVRLSLEKQYGFHSRHGKK